ARRANTNAMTASKESTRARAAEHEARAVAFKANRDLYAADMNLAQQAWDHSNIGRILALLEETRQNPDRGWEWGYWHRLCHLEIRRFEGGGGFYLPATGKIVTGAGNTVYLYDARTGRETRRFQMDQQNLTSACASRDGSRIATISPDGAAVIWD